MSARTVELSVAMCTFDGAPFLEEQLVSIGEQSRPPDELVICDDGSSDGSFEAIERFSRAAPFPVRLVVNGRRLGPTKNFEKAISLCQGTLIALADQDDVWHPDKLATQEELLRSAGLDAVFSDAEVVGPDLQPLGYRLWDAVGFDRRDRTLVRLGRPLDVLLRKDVVMGATLLFRARHRAVVLPIPEGWVHDAWIALVIAAAGRVGFVERPLVMYRQHGANQIGARAPRTGLLSGLSAAYRASGETFARQVDRYLAACESFRALVGGGRVDRTVLEEIETKADHVRSRARLPRRRIARVPLVAKELFRGRYHRYSGGWRSVGKDLLRAT